MKCALIPILATPFAADGSLDLPSLRRLIEFQLESQVDGLATFGMASEAFALTPSEREQIWSILVEVNAGAVPLTAGISATSTVTAIEQATSAAAAGAAALMVLPPFLVKPSPAQLIDFYGEIAAATGIPVMVQDAVGATGVAMSPALISGLSRLPGVTSAKLESPPTALQVGSVKALVDADFVLLGGRNAQFVFAEYAAGATGTMPACEFSDLLQPVLRDLGAGRDADARAAFRELLPLILFGLQEGIAWAVHKEVLVHRKIIESATVRSPARVLPEQSRQALGDILADLPLGEHG